MILGFALHARAKYCKKLKTLSLISMIVTANLKTVMTKTAFYY